jgi:hypothetical protein
METAELRSTGMEVLTDLKDYHKSGAASVHQEPLAQCLRCYLAHYYLH